MSTVYQGYEYNEMGTGSMCPNQYEKLIDLLEAKRPKNISGFGLGIATFIMEQYCRKYGDATVKIIDHSVAAATLHQETTVLFPLKENTSHEVANRVYDNCNEYAFFTEWLANNQDKYDFLLIDGPPGNDFRENYLWGRVQLLDYALLDKLADNATILIHDTERVNMQKTLAELESILTNSNIQFTKTVYGNMSPNYNYNIDLTVYELQK